MNRILKPFRQSFLLLITLTSVFLFCTTSHASDPENIDNTMTLEASFPSIEGPEGSDDGCERVTDENSTRKVCPKIPRMPKKEWNMQYSSSFGNYKFIHFPARSNIENCPEGVVYHSADSLSLEICQGQNSSGAQGGYWIKNMDFAPNLTNYYPTNNFPIVLGLEINALPVQSGNSPPLQIHYSSPLAFPPPDSVYGGLYVDKILTNGSQSELDRSGISLRGSLIGEPNPLMPAQTLSDDITQILFSTSQIGDADSQDRISINDDTRRKSVDLFGQSENLEDSTATPTIRVNGNIRFTGDLHRNGLPLPASKQIQAATVDCPRDDSRPNTCSHTFKRSFKTPPTCLVSSWKNPAGRKAATEVWDVTEDTIVILRDRLSRNCGASNGYECDDLRVSYICLGAIKDE